MVLIKVSSINHHCNSNIVRKMNKQIATNSQTLHLHLEVICFNHNNRKQASQI